MIDNLPAEMAKAPRQHAEIRKSSVDNLARIFCFMVRRSMGNIVTVVIIQNRRTRLLAL